MADLRVRFIGDLGNLRTFFSSIQGQANQTFAQLESLSRRSLSSQLGILPQFPLKGAIGQTGLGKLTLDLDSYNNTIKQTASTLLKLPNGSLLPIGDVTTASADLSRFTGILQNYASEVTRLRNLTAPIRNQIETLDTQKVARTAVLRSPIDAQINALRNERSALSAQYSELKPQIALQQTRVQDYNGIVQTQAQERLNLLLQEQVRIRGQISTKQLQINALERQYSSSLVTDNALLATQANRNAAVAGLKGLQTQLATTRALRDSEIASAFAAGPPVPKNIQTTLERSPQLAKILQQAGLGQTQAGAFGLGQQGFGTALYAQEANFRAPVKDLVRDVTRVGGSFKDPTGQIVEFSGELDKSGKVLTRFGGQLSGAGAVLKQISRDFQKVIEWTVATTLVFGTLRYAVEQLTKLKDLDAALQRFAITAQLAPKEATQSFDQLTKIATDTATPLLEIISAADDIALATKRAGQSTQDWQRDIFSLTESVGIFTNLTGVDTVTATDLLTASMKQLNLQAAQVPELLSKITAVAGGQSQAIADITKGLSVMAEAGKQANLNVDQQIATVQVLSQVTSKTPAEVATAFKNLVGSLGSPAALKALTSYNIAARDQAGNLRNILDIYGEISQKIKSGAIAAADVQGLVRAISGGPRRAPDAAALLNAIDQIAIAQRKSAEATNEAGIANAKVLDTTKAKIVQLQNQLDSITFKKFDTIYKEAITGITNVLGALIKIFDQIPVGTIGAILQFTAFFALIRGGVKFASLLVGAFRGLITSLVEVAASFGAATIAATKFQQSTILGANGKPLQTPISGTSGLRGALGGIGAGALIGGALSASSGGSLGQTIGGALQGAGFSALAAPLPIPWLKVAGAISLAVGSVLQFVTANKEATESETEHAAKVVAAYSKYKDAYSTIKDLGDQQLVLSTAIEKVNNNHEKTAEDLTALAQYQKDYVANDLAMIDATNQLASAQQDLIHAAPELAQAFAAAARGSLDPKQLDDLVKKYEQIILLTTNPELGQLGKSLPDIANIPFAQYTASSTIATRSVRGRPTFDLKDLEGSPEKVKGLFNNTGTAITATFEIAGENIDYVNGAIRELIAKGDPLGGTLLKTFNSFSAAKDGITQAANALAIYGANLQALTIIDPTKASKLSPLLTLGSTLISSAEQDKRGRTYDTESRGYTGATPGETQTANVLRILDEAFKTGNIDMTKLREASDELYSTQDDNLKRNATSQEFFNGLLEKSGFDLKALGLAGVAAFEGISEAQKQAQEDLEKFQETIASDISGRLVDLRKSFLSGDINASQYTKAAGELRKFLAVEQAVTAQFDKALDTKGFEEAFDSIRDGFTSIVGLEAAGSDNADQFIERVLQLADSFGISGGALTKLQGQLSSLAQQLHDLAALQTTIQLTLHLNTTGLAAQIQEIRNRLASPYGAYGQTTSDLQGFLNQLLAIQNAISGTTSQIGTSLKGGTGTSYGTVPKSSTGSGYDTSTIDLPDEIANALNRTELINQAIANAKKLQSSIPGATKDAQNDIVELLKGTQNVLEVRGIKDDYLRKALEELADVEKQRLAFDTKADTIRRIRVGSGDFSAIANVPLNANSGVSVGGPTGPINVTLNLNGTLLTPAQFSQFADLIAAQIKRQIANG